MITIRDVAALAGVSVATVSRVLNNAPSSKKSRQAVLQAVETLGYCPNANAQALALKNTDTVGVVVTDVTDPFFAILVKTVDQVATEYGKSILIGIGYHNAEKELNAIESLLRKRCNCLIVHSKALDDEILKHYLESVPSMVIINRVIEGYEHRCVDLDNEKGTFLATEKLIKLGHKHIAYIGSNHYITDEFDRKNGYLKALKKYNLSQLEHAIVHTSPDFEGGEEAMIELLSYHTDLTAIVAYNDNIAAGALSVLNENNIKVPEQFSIIGFDDVPIAKYLVPKLTTIRYPIDLMASYATKLALNLANKEIERPTYVKFKPTLVKRFSTKGLSNK
ncbi:substrate-binding domain-containing protein [Pasteurella skyensis]|uniref:Substrate-binding domain-containing protein n=1 Tax=Phocoenobacter skyensis TaxID=97481 RepID=A0AAJ6P1C3_9PAST|nr:substrate-binding domain-containing protein [Pasteurella skyensis]MDP8163289.1 substrate-binding domain-containing protein [Pasteurella skyensis]MDP8173490.1 substrate-binding domain-containing protein [Pasteurella skyensis]MDP8177280.1 substrate-binding domain-containing protein [Pasteurella skyensis]MDP8179781.1 substrate-binding domain-containing protein [Pasteurella skyensis]MDP8183895.1 substrate-binding domain-containing protein [Pasteurella skyensis]